MEIIEETAYKHTKDTKKMLGRSLASYHYPQKLESLLTLQTFNKAKQVSQNESTHGWFEGSSEVCLQTCFSFHMVPIKYCNGFNI